LDNPQEKILITREAIEKRVREIADAVSRDYQGRELVVIGVLKGAFIFMADLVRALRVPCVIDFVRLASYGSGSQTAGKVVLTKDLETSIRDKDILIVEDMVYT